MCNETEKCKYQNNCNCHCNSQVNCHCDDALFKEVEKIAKQVENRRMKENRCARQFINCMRQANNDCYPCDNDYDCNCNCHHHCK